MTVSSINDDYRRIGEQIASLLGRPRVSGLYLPAPVADETFRDEFGFVFLANDGIGPFYVSMDDILPGLWQRYPRPERCDEDAISLLQGFRQPGAKQPGSGTGHLQCLERKTLSGGRLRAAGPQGEFRTERYATRKRCRHGRLLLPPGG